MSRSAPGACVRARAASLNSLVEEGACERTMIAASCPHCRDTVRVPDHCRPGDRVRCPWCAAEFTGKEILDQLPPLLEIVEPDPAAADADGPATPAETGSATPGRSEDSEAWQALVAMAGEGDAEEAAEGALEVAPWQASDSSSAGTARARLERQRTPRSSLELFKIAAGGVAAVPIALFILLWLERDILHIGPTLGRYAPWLVPARYRPETSETDAESGRPSRRTASRNRTNEGTASRSVFQDGKVVREPPLPKEREKTRRAGQKPTASHKANRDATSGASASRGGQDHAKDARPHRTSAEGKKAIEPDVFAVSGLSDAPAVTAEAFAVAVERAERDWAVVAELEKTSGITPEVRSRALEQCYASLARLGKATVLVDGPPAALEPAAERAAHLLKQIAADIDHLPCVLLFGTAGKTRKVGTYFATPVTVASKTPATVELISVDDPADIFAPGSRILVLGVLIADPQTRLVGYQGQAQRVVLGGLPQSVDRRPKPKSKPDPKMTPKAKPRAEPESAPKATLKTKL